MQLTVRGASTYCYTGGKPFDAARPTVVFIHGVLNDHSVWGLQSRYLANHGWNVLAVDLPGHCRSEGEAPATVEAGAEFIAALLDAAGAQRAALVGHSWGSLIALEAASRLKHRITKLALVGTAYPMKVSPQLLDDSLHAPEKAIHAITVFSWSTLAPPPSVLGPGTWIWGTSKALCRRVLASNAKVNVFHRGFKACDLYANGIEAIAQVTCPILFLLGDTDQMTQPKAAQTLVKAAREAGKQFQVHELHVGHKQMTETPDATLQALKDFLHAPSTPAPTNRITPGDPP